MGKHQGGQERRQEQGKCLGQGLYWGFEGKARQGRVNSVGLAPMNNFSGLRAIAVIFSGLAPSPGMVKAEEYSLLGCMNQTEKVWL